ncbi:MAG: DUF4054 domain-containing protein [Methylocystis sp.]
MAFAIPTAGDLKARFPAFAAVADAAVTSAITEAQTRVDTTWTDQDGPLAIMLYAAHVMTLDGLGVGAEAEMAKAGALGFQTMRSGALTLERKADATGGAGDRSILNETMYGRRFLALLKVNQPAVALV